MFSALTGLLSSSKAYIAVAVVVAASMVFLYVSYLNNKVDSLSGALISQRIVAGEQQKTIITLNNSIGEMKAINKQVAEITRQAQEQEKKLIDSLDKLGKVTAGKPKLVEGIINRAAKDRLRCIEIATGAEIKKDESNRVCPQYFTKQ